MKRLSADVGLCWRGREQVAAFGFRKTLGGKTQAKNESSSPALLPAEWRLQKKKKRKCKGKSGNILKHRYFVFTKYQQQSQMEMRGNMAFKQFSTMLAAYFPIYARQKTSRADQQ